MMEHKEKYNIVLIGCGHMGEVHLRDIYLKENANVYGVVDLNEDRAKLFAKKFGAESYGTDYMKYLKDDKTDIVICATYTKTHLEILKNCIKYKKHLICEKPISTDIESGKEFVSLVKSADIKVLVGYILRHNDTYKKTADMITNGLIGSPLVIRMTQNHHVINWEKYRALLEDASPIVDCGVHYIDICRWFTGAEVTAVDGISSRIDDECPPDQYNYGLMTMHFSDGSIAYYEAGWGSSIAASNVKEFIGPKGRIRIVERENREWHEEGDLIEFYDKKSGRYNTINVDCIRRPTGAQLDHLIKMIEQDVPAIPLIDDVFSSFSAAIKADEMIRK